MSKLNKRITCTRCETGKNRSAFGVNERLLEGVTPWCLDCIQKLHTPMATRTDRKAYRTDYQRAYQAALRKKKGPELARKAAVRKAVGKIPELTILALRTKEMYSFLWTRWQDIKKAALEEFQCDICKLGMREPRFIYCSHAYPELIFAPSNRICWCVPMEMIDVSEVDWSEVPASLEKLREVLNNG